MIAGSYAAITAALFPERCFSCRAVGSAIWCVECASDLSPIVGARCPRCGDPDSESLCEACRRDDPGFDTAASAFRYEGSLRALMLAFKYHGYRRLAAPLGARLEALVQQYMVIGCDLVVPMPSDPLRRWRRGFNPAELLARAAVGDCGFEIGFSSLHRKRGGQPQVGLGRSIRRKNVEGRFYIREPEAVAGRRIVLVDDVFTTGATCSEAARALKKAGAAAVHAVTLARD